MRKLTLIVAAGLLTLAVGCETTSSMFKSDPKAECMASVRISDPNEGTVTVDVVTTRSAACEGVRHMRNEDWPQAQSVLEKVTADNTNDHEAHFALGVVYEKTRQYAKAIDSYKRANFLKAKPEYDEGRRRVEAAMN